MSLKELRIKHLRDNGVVFDEKNNGEHIIIVTLLDTIDYWPSTDKFKLRSTGGVGFSLGDLLNRIGIPRPADVDEVTKLKARIAELEALLETARAHNGKLPWE